MSTAADLRTLVTRRVGTGRRVALLGSDPTLVNSLEGNGCTVLVDPAGLDELVAFAPGVLVAFDGVVQGQDGAEVFANLVQALPEAEVVFSFANAASASTLVGALTGGTPLPSLAEPEVRRWLVAAGLKVVSRDVVVVPHRPTSLSADAEAALRALLEQLNPDAAADRFLMVARRGIPLSELEQTRGLLSVVVRWAGDQVALDRTVFALACQPRRPLQVVVEGGDQGVATAVLERHRSVGQYESGWVARDGLAAATGQYVALLEAGDLVYPDHFVKLVGMLERGTAAWALARSRRSEGNDPLTGKTEPVHEGHFSAGLWLKAGAVERCALVVDRARLGPFTLTLPEGVEGAEAVLFARLAAVFPPAFVPGLASVERPASNGVPSTAGLVEALRARPLRLLVTLEELLREGAADSRPQLVDQLSAELKKRAPQVHQQLKSLAARLSK